MSSTHTLHLNGVTVSGTNSLTIVDNKLSGLVAPTADTDAANMGYVNQKIADVVGSAPDLLNTLHELSLAINSDPSFASTIGTQIGANASAIANEVSRATAAEAAAISTASADASSKVNAEAGIARAAELVLRTDLATLDGQHDALQALHNALRAEHNTLSASHETLRNSTATSESFAALNTHVKAIYDYFFNHGEKPAALQ